MEQTNTNKGLKVRPSNIDYSLDSDKKRQQTKIMASEKPNHNIVEGNKNIKFGEIGSLVSELEKISNEPVTKSNKNDDHVIPPKDKGSNYNKGKIKDAEDEETSLNLSDSIICIDDSTDFAKAISPKFDIRFDRSKFLCKDLDENYRLDVLKASFG